MNLIDSEYHIRTKRTLN